MNNGPSNILAKNYNFIYNKTNLSVERLAQKTTYMKKQANFHRKQKRRKRKTEDDAKRALESGSVVVLVDKQVPDGALALLGKGLNFTPTPTTNIREEQFDMRLNTNCILNASNRSRENDTNTQNTVPQKLP